MVTCPVDCTPQTLETTWSQNNGSYGNYFKVRALKDITITGFEIHTRFNDIGTVQIYHKEDDYVNFERNSGAWDRIMNDNNVQGRGIDVPTVLDSSKITPVEMLAGEFHSFYIHTSSELQIRYTNGNGEGNLYASNLHLEFYQGKGGGSTQFNSLFSPRIWNGRINYGLTSTGPSPTSPPTNVS